MSPPNPLIVHPEDGARAELANLRKVIDDLDERLLAVLAERLRVVRRIGDVKRRIGLGALQPARLREILETRVERGRSLDLSTCFVHEIFDRIHREAVLEQLALLTNHEETTREP